MTDSNFFESPEPQSIIKSRLVLKYFGAWATLMLAITRKPDSAIAYVDLFSGPGRFEDGSASTPLWVLNHALKNDSLCRRLKTIFNDKKEIHVKMLENEINSIDGIEQLIFQPQLRNIEVGSELMETIRDLGSIPTLFFVDPFGYKGLSLDLIGKAIGNWDRIGNFGCDCIFFFNYNRINPGLNNPMVAHLMEELFGAERLDSLRLKTRGLTPFARQTIIMSELIEALKTVGGRFVIPFEIKSQHGNRTSHYIIFVSKEFRGYHIMKEVMFGLSSDDSEVRSFEYVPIPSAQLKLPGDLARVYTIPALKTYLLDACAGRFIRVKDIYETFSIDTPYTRKHFGDALIELECAGLVNVDRPVEKRIRKGKITLGDDRIVTFPSKEAD